MSGASKKESADLERVVQWYPGHMVKAMRRIGEYLKLIDLVIEVIDARAPLSDENPMLDKLIGDRPRLTVLSRDDLAEPATTKLWVEHFTARGRRTIAAEARQQQSVGRILSEVKALAKARQGQSRLIVVGVPNSGKSSIINGLLKRAAAKTEDRAGVTRQLQWFRVSPTIELMDSPGILVPKIATPDSQWKLALIGAVPRERYDPEEIAVQLHKWRPSIMNLDDFAKGRGFTRKGGEIDYHNAAQSYIRAFGEGAFGRISLEHPNDLR